MAMQRRRFLHLAAGGAVLPALSRGARADTYPSRPVRLVVGFDAGGAPDIVARLIGQSLAKRLGQTFVIENRAGAGTNIATETVAHAAPDGYTLLLVSSPNMINASLYSSLHFNFVRDIAAVGTIGRNPFVMVVNPAFPARTVAEFIAYAKANPGKINMTSTGTGNLTYFTGELFKMMAGIDMVQVPSRGEMQAQSDLLTDRAQVMFDPIVSSIGYINAGKLRALAVTTAARLQTLPDVPTIGEFVPGYVVDGWLGVGAPKDTPAAIVDALNSAIDASLAESALKDRLAGLGFLPQGMSPAAFSKFIADETAKWADVVKFAKIKAD